MVLTELSELHRTYSTHLPICVVLIERRSVNVVLRVIYDSRGGQQFGDRIRNGDTVRYANEATD
jgi:hypothetical protein